MSIPPAQANCMPNTRVPSIHELSAWLQGQVLVDNYLVAGRRNGQAARADSVKESALAGLKGLGCSPATPECEQARSEYEGRQQGKPG